MLCLRLVSFAFAFTRTTSSLVRQRRLSVRYVPSDPASLFPIRPNWCDANWPSALCYPWYPCRDWWTTMMCSRWGNDSTVNASCLEIGTRIFCPNPSVPDYHYLSCTLCLISWELPLCVMFLFGLWLLIVGYNDYNCSDYLEWMGLQFMRLTVAKYYMTKVFIFRSSGVLMLMHSFIKLLRLRHQNNKYRGKKWSEGSISVQQKKKTSTNQECADVMSWIIKQRNENNFGDDSFSCSLFVCRCLSLFASIDFLWPRINY